jgi:hypothetical protein
MSRLSKRFIALIAAIVLTASGLSAQEPPPPIPRFVVDLHGNVLSFPDSLQLAESRGLNQLELPGRGLGFDVAAHVYPLRWRAIVFGVGGQLTRARGHQSSSGDTPGLRAVTERFTSIAPQLSFNFGSGTGWSYLSGGMSSSRWSLVPDGSVALAPDEERLKTINYGGGARWFIKTHVAFSFDVRFYAINPSTSTGGVTTSPRTTLVIIGAGVSLK